MTWSRCVLAARSSCLWSLSAYSLQAYTDFFFELALPRLVFFFILFSYAS